MMFSLNLWIEIFVTIYTVVNLVYKVIETEEELFTGRSSL